MIKITSEYIIACKKIIERLKFVRKSFLELVLFLTFCKQYLLCVRIKSLRHYVIWANFY